MTELKIEKRPIFFDVETVSEKEVKQVVFEKKRLLSKIALPFMYLLTIWVAFKKKLLGKLKINSFWFDGLSRDCRKIKEGAATWRALNIIYNFKSRQPSQTGIRCWLSKFWINIIVANAKAVRNRGKLVEQVLTDIIEEIAQKEEEVRLLSIASGSAEYVLSIIKKLTVKGINIKATLLDLDPTAIKFSRNLAKEYGIKKRITYWNLSTTFLEKLVTERFHIIEMIGFLDYRPYIKAIRLIKRIKKLLVPGGKFITGNTCPNAEQFFLQWVIDWDMIYRTPEQLKTLLQKGGFDSKIICEPQKIQSIAICKDCQLP